MRFEKFGYVVVIGISLAGCGKSAPGCSDSDSLALVEQIARGDTTSPEANMIFDLSKSQIKIYDIVTGKKEENLTSCSATILVRLVPQESMRDRIKNEGLSVKEPVPRQIEYQLQRTDEGKLRASVQGLE